LSLNDIQKNNKKILHGEHNKFPPPINMTHDLDNNNKENKTQSTKATNPIDFQTMDQLSCRWSSKSWVNPIDANNCIGIFFIISQEQLNDVFD
jgi:hypothetical protein